MRITEIFFWDFFRILNLVELQEFRLGVISWDHLPIQAARFYVLRNSSIT